MNKLVMILAVLALLGWGFSSHSQATEPSGSAAKGGFRTFEAIDLVGTEVKSPSGDVLGILRDFVFDREGRIAFAVVYYDYYGGEMENGKYVAIPYNLLTITETKPEEASIVLNVDKERLKLAPLFDRTKGLEDPNLAASVYRFFGVQPYWTEKEAGMATPEPGMEEME